MLFNNHRLGGTPLERWQGGKLSALKVVELLRSGQLQEQYKGLISVRDNGPFSILNYTKYCQIYGPWDEVTTRCRGLIVDRRDWSVAALPFAKFFNLNERGRTETRLENLPGEPFQVFEKVDGSLGIMWRDADGMPRIATRGSFESEQAIRGTEFLQKLPNLEHIPNNCTLLFEIVYNGNEGPVIRYTFEGLTLLAVMDRFTGQEISGTTAVPFALMLGIPMAQSYDFVSIEDILEHSKELPDNEEGYVVRFQSGLRVKVKGAKYLQLFRLASNFSEEKVIEAIVAGRYQELHDQMSEELQGEMAEVRSNFLGKVSDFQHQVASAWEQAPKGASDDKAAKKAFALWLRENVDKQLHGTLFELYMGKPVDYQQIVADRIKK